MNKKPMIFLTFILFPLVILAAWLVVTNSEIEATNTPLPPTLTATPSPTNTPRPTLTNTPTPEPSPTIDWTCGADSYNCPDFEGRCEQLADYWSTCSGDPSRLDGDNDNIPCETQCGE